ncbi:MAG: lipo-like protein [Proteobacteria bacterium]|nr:MAG: lipo-like protein [Pseudomonadota bacterium]QKK11819.1 MAG: lipo-like protein [Pseudomonadota bacterium]
MNRPLTAIGRWLARYLTQPVAGHHAFSVHDPDTLERILQPADVLLVEGELRISTAIKYLTQSTWSHAALYVGDAVAPPPGNAGFGMLIEADIEQGVIAVPLSKYHSFNTRVCRPVGLSESDRREVVQSMVESLGMQYDLKNVVDLMRYLLPLPPVPSRHRRGMLALGSGDPTRAICSSLIAQAFQRVRYPILPGVERCPDNLRGRRMRREIYRIRHHSLFAPRDFDLSPYFQIVKPTLDSGFDYQAIQWNDATDEAAAPAPSDASR